MNTAPFDKAGKVRAAKTRSEAARDNGDGPILPDNPAPYITGWLFDVGPVNSGGTGAEPISYRDLAAWQDINGVELMPWEAQLLRQLSGSYLVMASKASALDCPAPYSGTVDDLQAKRASIDAKLKAAFGSLKKAET